MKFANWLTLCVLTFMSLLVTAQDKPANRLYQIQTDKSDRVCIWHDYYGITYSNPKTLS